MNLRVHPINERDFEPFGRLVSCARADVAASSANLGTAERRDFLADLSNPRPGARLNLASFRCAPWRRGAGDTAQPLMLGMLEKHPASTQVFVPMSSDEYLVVVALGADAPDLTTVRAFVVRGMGIAYGPGVWHHPMIALSTTLDFACLVWEDGSSLDCLTHPLAEPLVVDGV